MKFDKIVGFGDSWIYGDELLDPDILARDASAHACWHQNDGYRESHCFLGLLGKHYGVPAVNFGIPGGSLQSTIWTFLWWLQREPNPTNCLVLVGLTDCDRFSHYDPNHVHYSNDPDWNMFVHSTWVEHGGSVISKEFRDLCKQQTVLTVCSDLNHYNYLQAALLFDGVSARNHMPLIQFHVSPPREVSCVPIPSLIWPEQNFCRYFLDRPDNQDRRYYKTNGHPNESGHEIIRDLLIPEIDRATMHK